MTRRGKPIAWTEHESTFLDDFERACRLRDEDQLVEAAQVLDSILAQLEPDDRKLRLNTHLQRGHVAKLRGDLEVSEQQFRAATVTAPKNELASISLFHVLLNQGRMDEALAEMVRYVTDRDCADYRELLGEGFRDQLTTAQRALADRARALLEEYRIN